MPPKKRTDGKWKYKSGWCENKQCEGTKPVNWRGTPMRICHLWEKCPCECHALITQMCEMADMERILPEQSAEYLAYMREQRAGLIGPAELDLFDSPVLSSDDGTPAHPDTSDPTTVPARDAEGHVSTLEYLAPGPVFTATPTGRRARGQLEEDVREVCEEFARDVYEWEHCTPKNVAERIAKKYAIEPPSTGAINAVWDRWEKLGFAKQDKKPSRFVSFVTDGSARTLAALKDRTKRDKKRTRAEIQRNPWNRVAGGR